MAIMYKARTGYPIKDGDAVCLISSLIGLAVRNGITLPDSVIAEMATHYDTRFRNRLYYTTGEPDPADPT